jgi:beta-phosphoglucomutase-like phosphatase (HAD superfamily)
MARVDACLRATDLDHLFPEERRFSAEDSLPAPTSKPDPAVYTHAIARLGVVPERTLAVEDSLPGALAAVAAGCRTVGNVAFVPAAERRERIAALQCAGVSDVIASWEALEMLLESLAVSGAEA